MKNMEFSSQDKQRLREFTGHLFGEQRVYVGDIVEYREGKYKELGEVQKRGGGYFLGGQPIEALEIVRVINMGGIRADGRYV
jgi:hypothetical protein